MAPAARPRSAGHGTTSKAVEFTAGGLLPGTVYHYRLTATSRFGNTAGADRTFKTAGHPPPQVATGGGLAARGESATLTGVINPQGANTTYFFQYGTTTAYGSQTFAAVASAGTATVPVAQAVTGLAQFTTFHYRLVAPARLGHHLRPRSVVRDLRLAAVRRPHLGQDESPPRSLRPICVHDHGKHPAAVGRAGGARVLGQRDDPLLLPAGATSHSASYRSRRTARSRARPCSTTCRGAARSGGS